VVSIHPVKGVGSRFKMGVTREPARSTGKLSYSDTATSYRAEGCSSLSADHSISRIERHILIHPDLDALFGAIVAIGSDTQNMPKDSDPNHEWAYSTTAGWVLIEAAKATLWRKKRVERRLREGEHSTQPAPPDPHPRNTGSSDCSVEIPRLNQ
jgi:hypothetical protein